MINKVRSGFPLFDMGMGAEGDWNTNSKACGSQQVPAEPAQWL